MTPQETIWNFPAPQVEQLVQTVSAVAEHAAAWNWPSVHVEQETQTPPLR